MSAEGFEGFATSAASLFGDVLPQPEESGEPRPKKQRLGSRTEDSLDARVVYRTPHWQQKNPAWLQRKVLEDAGYVAPEPEARREMVTTQDNAAEEVARAEKEWNEQGKSHHVLDHEVFSTSSEGSAGRPPLTLEQQRDVELRRSAKRRDRKRRAAAVLERREAKRRREAALLDDPDEQPTVGLLDEASPFGAAAAATGTGLLEASRPAEVETPQVDGDGRLYNFCLNRECPAYQCSEIRIQQKWDGKCCGMRNQPAVGQLTAFDEGVGGEDDGEDEEGSEGDDWSFNTEELAELAKEDPESAQMVTDIRKTYSGIGRAADADCADDAAEDDDEEEDEESESGSESDAAPDTAEQHAFVANCVLLLQGTKEALISPDGVHHVVEPMSTLVARLTTLVHDLETRTGVSFGAAGDEGAPAEEAAAPPAAEHAGATAVGTEAAPAVAQEERPLPSLGLDASEWFAFKQSALETIRLIRNEASSAKVAARPPKAPLVVDDKVYDI